MSRPIVVRFPCFTCCCREISWCEMRGDKMRLSFLVLIASGGTRFLLIIMARGRVLWQNLMDRNLIPWVFARNNHISHYCKILHRLYLDNDRVGVHDIASVCCVCTANTCLVCVSNQNSHLIIPRCDALALFALLLERVSFQES